MTPTATDGTAKRAAPKTDMAPSPAGTPPATERTSARSTLTKARRKRSPATVLIASLARSGSFR
eukprot:CAMPEP_0181186326 /NCGR_PEP_ID=MMETSP1096-20121128/9975_1 /TAXON_ID=156174 ORGANISM="Chrysochromulina ericina, Strain CCMP281" /NCGR_SAMPLE_ID=MMETSP1096 /ASSEMBLY_ACC=CAM_ASM_000453 /LENGTH=63 /DNA_ID=CAMNT_0023275217 /DNA_START=487 /DNA_END=675 /DNA_ORIENTATION=-